MINIYGYSSIGTFLASSFKLSGFDTALFSKGVRPSDKGYRFKCFSQLLGNHEITIPEVSENNYRTSLNIICSTCSSVKYYMDYIRLKIGGSKEIMLLQNGITSVEPYINSLANKENTYFIRASIGLISVKMKSNNTIHCNNNLPLLSLSDRSLSKLKSAGYSSLLSKNFKLDVQPNDDYVTWTKLVKSGPHFLLCLLQNYPTPSIEILNRKTLALRLFEEYFAIAEAVCPELIKRKDALRSI